MARQHRSDRASHDVFCEATVPGERGRAMIVRLWRGRAHRDRAAAYQAHVVTVVFPRLMTIAGYVGGRVLRREMNEEVEFLVATEWASWDAIRAFAGDDPEIAVIEPEARTLLTDLDERVRHFEVAHESRGTADLN